MTNPDQHGTLASFLRACYNESQDFGPEIKQQEVGNAIGVSGAYVNQLMGGRADTAVPKWDGERAYRFLRAFHLPGEQVRAVAERFGLNNVARYLDLRSQGRPVQEGKHSVKYMGKVSAGRFGTAYVDDEEAPVDIPEYILKHHDPNDIFALDVTGDSMMSEDAWQAIPEGTRVFFHSVLRPSPGDIVCCRLVNDDMSVLKVYRPGREFVTLQSHNASHRPIIIDEDNPAHVEGVWIGEVRTRS